MANSTQAFGFIPVDSTGQSYCARLRKVRHDSGDATALYVGDPVVYAGSASTDGYPTVIRATVGTGVTTDRISGVVVGFEPYEAIPTYKYGPASVSYYLHIAEATDDQLFLIKADAAVDVGNVGNTCQIVAGTGNSYTGLSGFQLDASELATTSTDQVIVVGFPEGRPDNEINATGVDVIVRVNMPTIINASAGV
jgi:hypothetical protein